MPNEPEREIEKTLKAYAKQRRDEAGAPRPMHPATRKMLREEALRTHSAPRSSRSSWGEWFGAFWPRLAVGAAVVVCAGLAGWYFFSDSFTEESATTLALNRVPLVEPSLASKSLPISAATPPAEMPAEDFQKKADASLAMDKLTLKAPATPALAGNDALKITIAPGSETAAHFKARTLDDTSGHLVKPEAASTLDLYLATNQAPLSAPASVMVAIDDRKDNGAFLEGANADANGFGGAAGGGAVAGEGEPIRRAPDVFFTQTSATSAGADTPAKAARNLGIARVLTSFRVEQANGQIRVIDSDGSVYAGVIVRPEEYAASAAPAAVTRSRDFVETAKDGPRPAASPAAAAAPAALPPAGASVANSTFAKPATQNLFFRVTGTNRSLNQPVEFDGQLLVPTPAPAAVGGKLQSDVGAGWSELSGRQVLGRVIIGGTNQIEINAQPLNSSFKK